MKNQIPFTALLLLTAMTMLSAQLSEQDVRQRLDMIHSGKIDQVRNEISELLRKTPNDPGVRYLDAYVTNNGDKAVKKYQMVVDQYPQYEFADDALYKVYQYYYSIGLYKTAEAKMNQLNQQYPNSIFGKNEAKPSEIGIQKPEPQVQLQITPQQDSIVEEKTESTSPSETKGSYLVQLGVYSQEVKAQEQARIFSSTIGREAIVFSKQSGGKTVFAVAFEGFTDAETAKVYGEELKSRYNLEWFVVKR